MVYNRWMAANRKRWLDLALPYGFLFALISKALAFIGRGRFWLTLALFTLLNLVAHLGIAALLWKIAKHLPDMNPKVLLYVYGWSPFVVLQYLTNLHNDILVAFLVLLAAYLFLIRRPLWTIPLLLASDQIHHLNSDSFRLWLPAWPNTSAT